MRRALFLGCLSVTIAGPAGAQEWSLAQPAAPNGLFRVTGASDGSFYAVGPVGKILRHDGTEWVDEISNTTFALNNVRELADGTLIAVGAAGTIITRGAVQWRAVQSASAPTIDINDVFGTSASSFIVVGGPANSSGGAFYYDGSEFLEMTFPGGTTSGGLLAIWGTDMNNVYAAGINATRVVHYDGNFTMGSPGVRSWTRVANLPAGLNTEVWRDAWGFAADDLYIVGGRGGSGDILHYDGATWTLTSVGGNAFTSVHGADGEVIVGGSNTAIRNGGAWDIMPTPGSTNGVWMASANQAYAVTLNGGIYDYDGTDWAQMGGGVTVDLNKVWVAGNGEVFAVGAFGSIAHYDGTRWTSPRTGTREELLTVGGTSANDVYAAGMNGIVLHYDGTTWSTIDLGTTEDLFIASGRFPEEFYIGGTGFLVVGDGTTFTPVPDVGNSLFRAVTKSLHGELILNTSRDFKIQDPTDPTSFYNTSMPGGGNPVRRFWNDGSNVYAVGTDGTVVRFDEAANGALSLETVGMAATETFFDAWGAGPDNVFAAGLGGVVMTFNGTVWSDHSFETADWRSIAGSALGRVYAVGERGRILLNVNDPFPEPDTVDMSIQIAADPMQVVDQVRYAVTVTNVGPERATGVKFSVAIPTGATYLDGIILPPECTPSATVEQADCDLGTVQDGDTTTLTFAFAILATGAYSTTATVRSLEMDRTPGSNTATFVLEGTATGTVDPGTGADLHAHFEDGSSSFLSTFFDNKSFDCQIENSGPDAATDVTIEVSVTGGRLVITEVSGDIAGECTPSESLMFATCVLQAQVPRADLITVNVNVVPTDGETSTINARIEAKSTNDPDTTNNLCTVNLERTTQGQGKFACGCETSGGSRPSWPTILALGALLLLRRRRRGALWAWPRTSA